MEELARGAAQRINKKAHSSPLSIEEPILSRKGNRKKHAFCDDQLVSSRSGTSIFSPPQSAKRDNKTEIQWNPECHIVKSVNPPNIVEYELLGTGKFGSVHRVSVNGYFCARKVIDTSQMTEQQRQMLEREVSLLQSLKHKNIISLIGQQVLPDRMILYLELGSASLHNVLCNIKEGKRPALTDTELYTIVEGILEALHYLSTQDPKVIHRDIKSDNVLVILSNESITDVKLCDFGLAKQLIPGKQTKKAIGSRRWSVELCRSGYLVPNPHYTNRMAPEVQAEINYDELADIWSFGMLVLELLTLEPPYSEVCVLDVKSRVLAGNLPQSFLALKAGSIAESKETEHKQAPAFRQVLCSVIEQCLKISPKERPSAGWLLDYIRNHCPFNKHAEKDVSTIIT